MEKKMKAINAKIPNLKSSEDLDDFIKILMKKKKQLSDKGLYKDADLVKDTINRAKERFVELKKNDVNEQHKLDKANLEENMMNEIEDFNKFWDDKMQDFEAKMKQIEKLINERHQEQFRELKQEMENYIPLIKPNHEYNVLKMTEMRLKKQDQFLEADDLKLKCEKLEKQEAENLLTEKNNKFAQLAARLASSHQDELNVAHRKIQDEYNIMINQKEKEYDKLMTRFKTRKIELDLLQKQQKNQNRDLKVIKKSKFLI